MSELQFPPVNENLNTGDPYDPGNGVTYTWNGDYSTWMIGSSQQVNKDYVDSRDQLRVRVDGKNHMYGDLIIRETAEADSPLNAQLGHNGVLTLGKNMNINFTSDGGSISVANQKFLSFSENHTNVEETLNYARHLEVLNVYKGSTTNITLFDCTSSSQVNPTINVSKNNSSYFSIKKHGSQYSLFRVKSDGSVLCRGGAAGRPFSVLPEGIDGDDAFLVDKSGGVFVSNTLNDRLLRSEGSSIPVEDHSVATKGYVDQKSPRPGYQVVAGSEEEADINGFWRNGNNLYIRIA